MSLFVAKYLNLSDCNSRTSNVHFSIISTPHLHLKPSTSPGTLESWRKSRDRQIKFLQVQRAKIDHYSCTGSNACVRLRMDTSIGGFPSLSVWSSESGNVKFRKWSLHYRSCYYCQIYKKSRWRFHYCREWSFWPPERVGGRDLRSQRWDWEGLGKAICVQRKRKE